MTDFFNKDASQSYDAKNSRLAPIADNMHFLIRLILKDLPQQARILCVGVGTGAEIISLAKEYPEWKFVGVDPSAAMLEACRDKLNKEGFLERCELVHGYTHELPPEENFDAALSILVGHFVKLEDRKSFYSNMQKRLKRGGYLVNTEISFDLGSKEFPSMLKNWEKIQTMMGATAESIKALPELLKNPLCVLPPDDVENLISESGIDLLTRFFQSFMIMGWYGRKA